MYEKSSNSFHFAKAMRPLCCLRAERQWLCNNIQLLPCYQQWPDFIMFFCGVWGWIYFWLSVYNIYIYIFKAPHRNKKAFRSSNKNANSAPEVRKTVARVERRNYVGDTVKVDCSLIVCRGQILSSFSILHSASPPQLRH